MVLSCTVTEIRRLIGWNCVFFLPLSYLASSFPKFPLEFRDEVDRQETRVMGLPGGESCMILTSIVFDWITRVTDRRTDGRAIAYTRYSIYAVARKNEKIHRTGNLCAVYGCDNRSTDQSGASFYRFPKDRLKLVKHVHSTTVYPYQFV